MSRMAKRTAHKGKRSEDTWVSYERILQAATKSVKRILAGTPAEPVRLVLKEQNGNVENREATRSPFRLIGGESARPENTAKRDVG